MDTQKTSSRNTKLLIAALVVGVVIVLIAGIMVNRSSESKHQAADTAGQKTISPTVSTPTQPTQPEAPSTEPTTASTPSESATSGMPTDDSTEPTSTVPTDGPLEGVDPESWDFQPGEEHKPWFGLVFPAVKVLDNMDFNVDSITPHARITGDGENCSHEQNCMVKFRPYYQRSGAAKDWLTPDNMSGSYCEYTLEDLTPIKTSHGTWYGYRQAPHDCGEPFGAPARINTYYWNDTARVWVEASQRYEENTPNGAEAITRYILNNLKYVKSTDVAP